MPRKYPPLTLAEVLTILRRWGFAEDRSAGSHHQWKVVRNGRPYLVTVDIAKAPFDEDLIAKMVRQSGLTRDQFYQGCKSAARRVNLQPLSDEP